jgi:outer membrane protein OmpA-like peptidoglycan-associated protein
MALTAGAALAQPAQDQETDIPGVTARLLLVRHDGTTSTIAIVLRNTGTADAQSSAALAFSKFVLVDTRGGTKHFPLKDQNGHYLAGPISNWNGGGTWFPVVPAQGTRTVFAIFERLPAGSKVSIQAPLLPPLDNVDLDQVAGRPPAAEGMPHGALTGEIVSAARANGQARVRMKVQRAAAGYVDPAALKYVDVSLLDPQNRRQYWLLKDTDGHYSAQPTSNTNEGGSFFLGTIAPKGQTFLNLGFTPPPDTTTHVLLLVPFFLPTPIDLAGSGGATDSGTSASGRTIGLEKALSDLKADVTPERIKIHLAADVLFDFDKADIKRDAEPSLTQVATVLKAYPDATIDIEGHTDGKGADAYNNALSEKRAAAVADWLSAHAAADRSRFHTRGFGKTKPVASNTKPDGSDDPEGRAKNRRVEVVVNRKG